MNPVMKYIRKVLAFLRKADETFSLIAPKDRILVGISGGKDSMALLHALSIYRKFSQKDFVVVPVSLDLGFPGYDSSSMEAYAKSLGLTLRVEDSKEIYPILLAHTKEGHHIPCSICSRMKKAAINAAAKKYRCNKVAFAHHQDDALETLFMNMIHGGKVATFEPEMRLSRAGITFIRPFIFVSEDDIRGMVKEENIPVLGKTCPADGFTEREYVKQRLIGLYQERPDSKTNFANMLSNYEPFMLYFDRIYYAIPGTKNFSFKPAITPKDIIAYNALLSKNPNLSLIKDTSNTVFFFCVDKKIVGRVEFKFESAHVMVIHACEGIAGIDLPFFLDAFIQRTLARVTPLYVVYKAKGKAIAKKLGFRQGIVPNFMKDYGSFLKK